jgi:DNA-binding transcriptional ArsR family regulator
MRRVICVQKFNDFEALNRKAELLKCVAHPVRLCIIRGLLTEGECNVNKMQSCLDVPQSTLSQHLAKLRSAGVIKGRREGTEIFYRVVNAEIAKVVSVLCLTDSE